MVHDASTGVPLAAAVTASCAVPGTGPTITVADRPTMDGGMRSATNADVAADCDRVLVVACLAEAAWSPFGPSLSRAVAALESGGSAVLVVEADAASRTAFGTNPLLVSTRSASAAAGHAQAAAVAEAVDRFWAA